MFDLPGGDVSCLVPAAQHPALAALAIRRFRLDADGLTTIRSTFQIARWPDHFLWREHGAVAAETNDGRWLTEDEYMEALSAVLNQPALLPEALREALHGRVEEPTEPTPPDPPKEKRDPRLIRLSHPWRADVLKYGEADGNVVRAKRIETRWRERKRPPGDGLMALMVYEGNDTNSGRLKREFRNELERLQAKHPKPIIYKRTVKMRPLR
jgi:hypothetical protein